MHENERGKHLLEKLLGDGLSDDALGVVDVVEELTGWEQLRGNVVSLEGPALLFPGAIKLPAKNLHNVGMLKLFEGSNLFRHVLVEVSILGFIGFDEDLEGTHGTVVLSGQVHVAGGTLGG